MKIKTIGNFEDLQSILQENKVVVNYSNEGYDAILVNVDKSGVECLKEYNDVYRIVVVETLDHLNYVLNLDRTIIIKKPYEEEYVVPMIKNLKNTIDQTLTFKHKNIQYRIPFEDIVYIKSDKRIVQVFDQNGVRAQTYSKLDEINQVLPDTFVRIHQSYLINLNYLESVGYKDIKMKYYTDLLPISRSKINEVKNYIKNGK